jgi:hypothetical protein
MTSVFADDRVAATSDWADHLFRQCATACRAACPSRSSSTRRIGLESEPDCAPHPVQAETQ